MKKLICSDCGGEMLNPICKKGIWTSIKNCIRFHSPKKMKLIKEEIKLEKEYKAQRVGMCTNCNGMRQAK